MSQHLSRHLSQEEIDGWLIGDRPAEVESHLTSCEDCAEKVAGMGDSLALFGSAVRSWGQEQMGSTRVFARPAIAWWRIGLVFATLLLLVAMPVVRHRQADPNTSVQDEVLLKKVQQEISQSVPAPLEPLAKLMPNDLSR
jgi:anti-sigma factor RsiW